MWIMWIHDIRELIFFLTKGLSALSNFNVKNAVKNRTLAQQLF